MTVIEYCREKTEVRELVVIRSGGYERCVAAVLFGPGIKITGNRPIIGRLVELINRPVCVVRRLETDEGEIVPVCSNCGEPIFLTDSFCPHCSAEVVGNEFDC